MGYWGRLCMGIIDAIIVMMMMAIFFPSAPGWAFYTVAILIANIEMARLEILDTIRGEH